ncbi:hypothetical protein Mal33_22590 [Rosistilla oblonga]|uniref:Uncharacterized protein n=1 Tax=Rosistilla oblonga TaxID=2527990 RepID=A0A518IT65_9BACT|nr:hypothetical protein Mal33_22590 [Rosistilla oblonga]
MAAERKSLEQVLETSTQYEKASSLYDHESLKISAQPPFCVFSCTP